MTTQIIFNGNEYEEARNSDRAERPDWPVQDSGAHWHYEQFAGQLVCFRGSNVHFGFMADEMPESDVPRDANGELNFNDLFVCADGKIYRAA